MPAPSDLGEILIIKQVAVQALREITSATRDPRKAIEAMAPKPGWAVGLSHPRTP